MYTGTAGLPFSRFVPWDQPAFDGRNKSERMPIELMAKQMNVNYIFLALDAPISGVIVFLLACCL